MPFCGRRDVQDQQALTRAYYDTQYVYTSRTINATTTAESWWYARLCCVRSLARPSFARVRWFIYLFIGRTSNRNGFLFSSSGVHYGALLLIVIFYVSLLLITNSMYNNRDDQWSIDQVSGLFCSHSSFWLFLLYAEPRKVLSLHTDNSRVIMYVVPRYE